VEREQVAGDGAQTEFGRHVREALHHLHDVVYLQTHSLSRLAAGEPTARSSQPGKALQRAILETIEALKPADAAQLAGRNGRTYQLLTLRYVEGLDLAEVEAQLGIGESEYHRSQRRALEAVTLALAERWRAVATLPAPAAPAPPASAGPAPVVLPGVAPAIRSLPLPLTSFVGRAREQEIIIDLLFAGRLLTLTGPPGAGKTRVALAVVEAVRDRFAGGAAFVPLGTVEDPQLVLSAIAKALGIAEAGGRSLLGALMSGIDSQAILLVLDNFEHVAAAAAWIAELVAACPQLTVLVTSRSPLKVQGEREFAVPPLAVPDLQRPATVADLLAVDAVALFVDRARAVSADFQLNEANAAAVAEICVRLDGIPLAIELAAARIKVFSPAALLARLAATGKTELRLLNRGQRDLPARQQTMWAAIDWSYSLLPSDERLVFRRLGVFSGSFSLEAAEAVGSEGVGNPVSGAENPDLTRSRGGRGVDQEHSLSAPSAAPREIRSSPTPSTLDPAPVLDAVSSLVDQSLLGRDDRPSRLDLDEQRFRFLELIRSYARERLLEDPAEAADLTRRHARWYVALAERAEAELRGARQALWFERLEAEHDNVRAALSWCLENDVLAGLRAAASLWRFWWLRGHHHEGRRWLDLLLAAPLPALDPGAQPAAQVTRARALHGAGFMAFHSGDRRARSLLEESYAILHNKGIRRGTGDTLRLLGRLAYGDGDLDRARALMEESLGVLRETGNRHGAAGTLHHLATLVWLAGDSARARALAEESLALFRQVHDPHGAGWVQVFLAQADRAVGDYGAAVEKLDLALAAFREVDHRVGIGWATGHLGVLALRTGDLPRAAALLDDCLRVLRESSYRPEVSRTFSEEAGVSWALGYLAAVAGAEGDDERAGTLVRESLLMFRAASEHQTDYWSRLIVAAQLAARRGDFRRAVVVLEALAAMHPALPLVLDPTERAELAAILTAARSALGHAYGDAEVAGRAFSLEQTIDEALVGL
jgi:predicted ATPase